jgi:hypothetical protein
MALAGALVNIEPKVKAATGGATAAAAVCWALTTYVFHGVLPVPVEALVNVAVPGVVAFLGGYLARHVDRPKPLTNHDIAAIAHQAAAGWKYIHDTYGAPTTAPTNSARPPEAAQHTETTSPEGNTQMSLLTTFENLVEELRTKLTGKVGPEVSADVHAALDEFKAQGSQLLAEGEHAAEADATQLAAESAQVVTDAAAAVETPASAPATVPAPATEAAPATPPATPTA